MTDPLMLLLEPAPAENESNFSSSPADPPAHHPVTHRSFKLDPLLSRPLGHSHWEYNKK
jgi:hypothetical protein